VLPRGRTRTSSVFRWRRFLDGLTESPERRYARWLCGLADGSIELCTPEFLDASGGTDVLEPLLAAYRESDAPDVGDATLGVDVGVYLPDDLLVKVDIATMAHSLEARSPFLDHEFMEFAATIPFALKVRGRTTKHILKRALTGLLPDEVLRRPKMGFGVPVDHWLRHELKDVAYDILLSPRAVGRGYCRPDTIRRMLDDHVAARRSWGALLWALLMLELWHRTYLDDDGELARRRALAAVTTPV
jgi:asparagine synthase (glutamine-hydrolysing)